MKLTPQDLWLSTVLFAFLALISSSLLTVAYSPELFSRSSRVLTTVSAMFWGILAVFMAWRFWDLYYWHFYPAWLKPLMPFSAVLYGALGYLLWTFSTHGDLPAIPVFLLLGGAAGVLEHAFAVAALDVLEKVPMLRELAIGPVLLFSFFEYAFYWSLVGWLTRAVTALLP